MPRLPRNWVRNLREEQLQEYQRREAALLEKERQIAATQMHSSNTSNLNWPMEANDYYVFEKLRAGARSAVYSALCIPLNKMCAVKKVKLDSSDKSSLQADLMSTCRHPNLLRCYCYFQVDGFDWIIAKLPYRGTLHGIIENKRMDKNSFHGVIKPAYIAYACREILHGMEYLHRNGWIHCDINARNILVDSEGQVIIGDFENCVRYNNPDVITRECADEFQWMAPEILNTLEHKYQRMNKGACSATDIWSLGILMLEMVTGTSPFCMVACYSDAIKDILMGEQPSLRSVSQTASQYRRYGKYFREMLSSCLIKCPHHRPTASKLLKCAFLQKYSHVTRQEFRELVMKYGSTLNVRNLDVNNAKQQMDADASQSGKRKTVRRHLRTQPTECKWTEVTEEMFDESVENGTTEPKAQSSKGSMLAGMLLNIRRSGSKVKMATEAIEQRIYPASVSNSKGSVAKLLKPPSLEELVGRPPSRTSSSIARVLKLDPSELQEELPPERAQSKTARLVERLRSIEEQPSYHSESSYSSHHDEDQDRFMGNRLCAPSESETVRNKNFVHFLKSQRSSYANFADDPNYSYDTSSCTSSPSVSVIGESIKKSGSALKTEIENMLSKKPAPKVNPVVSLPAVAWQHPANSFSVMYPSSSHKAQHSLLSLARSHCLSGLHLLFKYRPLYERQSVGDFHLLFNPIKDSPQDIANYLVEEGILSVLEAVTMTDMLKNLSIRNCMRKLIKFGLIVWPPDVEIGSQSNYYINVACSMQTDENTLSELWISLYESDKSPVEDTDLIADAILSREFIQNEDISLVSSKLKELLTNSKLHKRGITFSLFSSEIDFKIFIVD